MIDIEKFDPIKAAMEYKEARQKAKEITSSENAQKNIDEIAKKFGVPRDLVEHRVEAKFRQLFLQDMPNVPDIWKSGIT